MRFEILQICMSSLSKESGMWLFVWSFLQLPLLCEQTAKALARLRRCAGSTQPSLFAYVISTIFSCVGSINLVFSCGRYAISMFTYGQNEVMVVVTTRSWRWDLGYRHIRKTEGEMNWTSDPWMARPANYPLHTAAPKMISIEAKREQK